MTWPSIGMSVCMNVYTYMYLYIYTHTHTHTHTHTISPALMSVLEYRKAAVVVRPNLSVGVQEGSSSSKT